MRAGPGATRLITLSITGRDPGTSPRRDMIWVRISKEVVAKGVKIEHIGKLLASKFRMDFPHCWMRYRSPLSPMKQRCLQQKKMQRTVYNERDARIRGMRDADVNTYYSCTLCQTFAPNHVCVITPEHPAPLRSVSAWLDGKIAYEIARSRCQPAHRKGNRHKRPERGIRRRKQICQKSKSW